MIRLIPVERVAGLAVLSCLACVPPASAQAPGTFAGGVRSGQATSETQPLSLRDAVARALEFNLGLIESGQDARAARATRLRSLSALLPHLSARVSVLRQQLNLRAEGLSFTIPGVDIPPIVGPFTVADARGYLTQEVFNWSKIQSWRSAAESQKAAQLSYENARELVVLTTGSAYLLVISDGAAVESIQAQVKTADVLHQRAADQNRAGVVASIDVLRGRVELQTQQQRLIAAQNQLAIDKLALARIIGLPSGQAFELTDAIPYAPLATLSLGDALAQARATRPDYRSAQSQVRAAELSRQAAAAGHYPSLSVDGNFGDIGSPNFGTSHGTFAVEAALNVPVFQGGRVRADTLLADSVLERRRAELADLGGRIDDEVRTAFLNLKSSADLVTVAGSNVELAHQTLTQATDRFSAGVADNLEVVQAQETVAAADQSYIASLYAYNLAKLSLAQSIGVAQQSALEYLGVK
jgi:outer membrane protein TolC